MTTLIDLIEFLLERQGREVDSKTTVYKKTDEVYLLKLKASRAFFSVVEKTYGTLPFTLRAIEDEKNARMGLKECVTHKLLDPFTVLYEKDEEVVAQFKYTVLLLPNGSLKITGLPFDQQLYQSDNTIVDETLTNLLHLAIAPKSKKKNKNKKKEEGDAKSPEKGAEN